MYHGKKSKLHQFVFPYRKTVLQNPASNGTLRRRRTIRGMGGTAAVAGTAKYIESIECCLTLRGTLRVQVAMYEEI